MRPFNHITTEVAAMPVALISGATSGIGRAVAHRFFKPTREEEREHRVFSLSRTRPQDCGTMWDGPCDLANAMSLREHIERHERIDAIIHCAYTYEAGKIGRVGLDALEVLWLYGKARLQKSGGALVVVSSAAAANPDTPYALDKRAQERRALAFAKEGAPDVRVNIVRPHLIAGTRTHPAEDPKRAAELPLRRYGTPREVAEVVWLAATCRHTTGSTLTVDGGYSIR